MFTFTYKGTNKRGTTTITTTTRSEATLMRLIQKQKVVAMDKEGFAAVAKRIAKSPKTSWIKGLQAAHLIEYTPVK